MVNATLETSLPAGSNETLNIAQEETISHPKLLGLTIKGSPILTAAVIATGCAYVGLNNPEEKQLFPVCGFYSLTGFYCPGCGMTRALHNVLNFDLIRATQFNALLVIALPVLIYFYVWWVTWSFTGKEMPTFKVSRKAIFSVIAVAVIFMVGRNFPGPVAEFFALGRI